MSSMIHSARPTFSTLANIVFFVCGDERTDNMYDNNDPYRPWLWIGRVDQ